MKTLRVGLSKELPSPRDMKYDYFYLSTDKLILFQGQNFYHDPFIICETIPDDPVKGFLYIQYSDGIMKAKINDDIVDIAECENVDQIELLKSLGTMYFIHADKRYLDKRYRTLQLPYNNGTFSMSVSLAKDLRIDNNTVIGYDQERERWFIEGDHDNPLHRFHDYKSKDTQTVKMHVNHHCIHADIKISSAPGNLLRLVNGGLYVNTDNSASIENFKAILERYESFKTEAEDLFKTLQRELNNKDFVSQDSIFSMVHNAVKEYYSNIDEWLNFLTGINQTLDTIKRECMEYTDAVFDLTYDRIMKELCEQKIDNSWGTF